MICFGFGLMFVVPSFLWLKLMGKTIMVQALDAAFQHYEADLQKRSAKGGDKPNGYV